MDKRKKLIVFSMAVGMFLCMLDTTVMNIALPKVQTGLHDCQSDYGPYEYHDDSEMCVCIDWGQWHFLLGSMIKHSHQT